MGAPGISGFTGTGIESGSCALDYAFGGIGIPRGAFTMIDGATDVGKTTITMLYGITGVQSDLKVMVINREGRWRADYANSSGMGKANKDYLLLFPIDGESSVEAIRIGARRKFDICIVESIAALAPGVEITGDFRDANVGLMARMMSKFFRDAVMEVANSDMAVIMTNQMREKIGVMYGSPETAPGGKAKDFNATVHARLTQPEREYVSKGDDDKYECTGMTITGKTRKSTGFNHRKISCPVQFVNGLTVQKPVELMDFGLRLGMFQLASGEVKDSKAGSWVYKGVSMGNSEKAAKLYLTSNEDLASELDLAIRSVVRTGQIISEIKKSEKDGKDQ